MNEYFSGLLVETLKESYNNFIGTSAMIDIANLLIPPLLENKVHTGNGQTERQYKVRKIFKFIL